VTPLNLQGALAISPHQAQRPRILLNNRGAVFGKIDDHVFCTWSWLRLGPSRFGKGGNRGIRTRRGKFNAIMGAKLSRPDEGKKHNDSRTSVCLLDVRGGNERRRGCTRRLA
jgi:hypothetical protein